MKTLLFIVINIINSFSTFAQDVDLSKMDSVTRNEYLCKLAKNVTITCGPGYYRKYMIPKVSKDAFVYQTEHLKYQKDNGRKYYKVFFLYDASIEPQDEGIASQIWIWEDDGQPVSVDYANSLGYRFTADFTYKNEYYKTHHIQYQPFGKRVISK